MSRRRLYVGAVAAILTAGCVPPGDDCESGAEPCRSGADAASSTSDATPGDAPWQVGGELEQAFPLVLGRPIDGRFVALEDGDEIEIGTAGQGRIHLELGFRATLPAGPEDVPLRFWIDAATVQPCGEADVGRYADKRTLAYPLPGAPGVYERTGGLYVVFDELLASVYGGQDCCIRLSAGVFLAGEAAPLRWATAERRLRCIDYF